MAKLVIVVSHWLPASTTGRQILSLGGNDAQAAGAAGIVTAVVGVRSPATLTKRANSLLAFLRWAARARWRSPTPSPKKSSGDTSAT